MDTKLEARGQFPASFPDTFKNFFAMMNEDEDHVGLFASLLEDKVVPVPSHPWASPIGRTPEPGLTLTPDLRPSNSNLPPTDHIPPHPQVIPRHSSPVVPAQRQRYGGSMRSHSGGDSSGRADRLYSQLAQGQQVSDHSPIEVRTLFSTFSQQTAQHVGLSYAQPEW